MEEELIAPCGMNCNICSGYLACKSDVKSAGIKMLYCTDCRSREKKCAFFKKKRDLLLQNKLKYCYKCADFPCSNLQKLDARYRRDFRMKRRHPGLGSRALILKHKHLTGIDSCLNARTLPRIQVCLQA